MKTLAHQLAWQVAIATLLFAIILIGSAYAQDSSVPVGSFFVGLKAYIDSAVNVVVTAALAFGALRLNSWVGVQIEAKHREALHSAVMTGIRRALNGVEAALVDVKIDVKSPAMAKILTWVMETGAPEAVKYFGLTPDKLASLIESKVPLAKAEIATGTV